MECNCKILREKKIYHPKNVTYIQIYCPIMGEVVLQGEAAEKIREKIKMMEEKEQLTRS